MRVTRSRSRTPGTQAQLPALDAKQSHAYGAAGKTQLRSQLRAESASFADDFATTRQASVPAASQAPAYVDDEDEDDDEVPDKRSPMARPKRRNPTSRKPTVPAIAEEKNEQRPSSRLAQEPTSHGHSMTDLDSSAEYAGVTARRPVARVIPARQTREVEIEPSRLMVFYYTLPRYLRALVNDADLSIKWLIFSFLCLMGAALLTGFVADVMPVPSAVVGARENVRTGLKIMLGLRPAGSPTEDREGRWDRDQLDALMSGHVLEKEATYGPYFESFKERLDRMDKRVAVLEDPRTHVTVQMEGKPHYSLRIANWFSVGQGARIDPYNTSPRAGAKRNWYQSIFAALNPSIVSPNPPITALQIWDEAGECWCTEPSKTFDPPQIAIMIPKKIYPEVLVIDHIPAAGTFDIAAAPKNFELWADAGTKEAAERFYDLLHVNITRFNRHLCGEKPAAGDGWVCIREGFYDIHHRYNYVQEFEMWENMKALNFPVNKVIVRFDTNWGADHTCIYRLRMTGQKAEE